MQEAKSYIIKKLKELSYSRNISNVFDDVVICCAYAIANRVSFSQKREDTFNNIYNKYSKDEQSIISSILANISIAYSDNDDSIDLLGDIYIELGLINKNLSQFFTPLNIAYLMASVAWKKKEVKEEISKNGYIQINDSCCGSGRLLYSAYNNLKSFGIESDNILLCGEDLDLVCCCITYLQLSAMGACAVITNKNTLTNEKFEEFYTPAYARNKKLQIKECYGNLNIIKNEVIKIGYKDMCGLKIPDNDYIGFIAFENESNLYIYNIFKDETTNEYKAVCSREIEGVKELYDIKSIKGNDYLCIGKEKYPLNQMIPNILIIGKIDNNKIYRGFYNDVNIYKNELVFFKTYQMSDKEIDRLPLEEKICYVPESAFSKDYIDLDDSLKENSNYITVKDIRKNIEKYLENEDEENLKKIDKKTFEFIMLKIFQNLNGQYSDDLVYKNYIEGFIEGIKDPEELEK